MFKNPKIDVVWDSALDDVMGSDNPMKVRSVRLKNVKTGAVTERNIDGVFIAIGHSPASELFVGQVQMKPSGYIVTDRPFHRHVGGRRIRRRRRHRRYLPAGGDRGGTGLHGGARSGEIPGGA